MGRSVILKKIESIAILSLNRPEARNAINFQLASEFRDFMENICRDEEIKVLIITGEGEEAFSSGTDREGLNLEEALSIDSKGLSISSIVGSFPFPTIAAINGDAFGQGLELAISCDLRISAKEARFSMPQVIFGEIPWDGGTQRLARIIGKGKALEMILTGEIIDSQEAYRIGLVNRVVPRKDLMEDAISLGKEMAKKAPLSLRFAKEAVCKGIDLTLEQGLRLEADLYFLLHTTHDRIEGIRAFIEKRPPNFKGR
jgi:enoyl-CoA hydratase